MLVPAIHMKYIILYIYENIFCTQEYIGTKVFSIVDPNYDRLIPTNFRFICDTTNKSMFYLENKNKWWGRGKCPLRPPPLKYDFDTRKLNRSDNFLPMLKGFTYWRRLMDYSARGDVYRPRYDVRVPAVGHRRVVIVEDSSSSSLRK